jgi:serine/threonine protein kinase
MKELLISRPNYRLSEQEARHIILQVLTALEYVHAFGITHRNVHLSNIYVNPSADNQTKLGDFLICPKSGSNNVSLQSYNFHFSAPESFMTEGKI